MGIKIRTVQNSTSILLSVYIVYSLIFVSNAADLNSSVAATNSYLVLYTLYYVTLIVLNIFEKSPFVL